MNKEQIERINSENNVIVIAGRGSGKTHTFTQRLKNKLIKVNDNEVLGLTFTEKAREEFKHRLEKDLYYFGTFHSVFYKLIKDTKNPLKYNFFKTMKIKDESSYNYYLNNQFQNNLIQDKQFKVKIGSLAKLDKFISEHKELCLKCSYIEEYFEKLNEKLLKHFYFENEETNIIKKFYSQKREDKILSFDDIIIYTYFLMKECEDTRTYYKNKFKIIQIDEFQDTNRIVLETIEMISNQNLFMVGDIYQSIYSFQGSNFDKTLNLINSDKFKVIQLKNNYRSNENIVNFSNSFIDKVISKKSNIITSVIAQGNKKNNTIKVIENINDYTIPKLINDIKIPLNDICILSRNNIHLEEIKNMLEKWNVPFVENSSAEIENFIYALFLNYISDFKLEHQYFKRFNINMIKDIFEEAKEKDIKSFFACMNKIFKNLHIINYFENRNLKDIQNRLLSIQDTLYKIFINGEYNEIFIKSLKDKLLNWLDNKGYIIKKGVNLMTIHKSKGLEWNTVILYNQEDTIFPRNIKEEEEKRLYYVAITRAKENLIITSKNSINSYTKKLMNESVEILKSDASEKKSLSFKTDYIDYISFIGDNKEKFNEYSNEELKEKYQDINIKNLVKKIIKDNNRDIQNKTIKNLNNYTIEDIECMIIDLKKFKKENKIVNNVLAEYVKNIITDKRKYFTEDKINYDFLNNEFTDYFHYIINFKNWMSMQDLKEVQEEKDETQIKRLKKIVLKFISKKNTDITKDRRKKSLEIKQRIINKKIKNMNIFEYEDFKNNMIKEYYEKSNKEKRFFVNNVLGMYDTVNQCNMIDLTDTKYDTMKRDIIVDFESKFKDGNFNYKFTEETLKGNFLGNKKRMTANKRWRKIKYLEFINRLRDCFFMTNTLNSSWHKWKTKRESLKEEREYGDFNILEDNPNFKMVGHNFEEHIKNSRKEIQKVWRYFYKTLSNDIDYYCVKNKIENTFKFHFYSQKEPHKNLTSHNHILFWVDKEVSFLVEKVLEKTIKEFNLNEDFQDLQKIRKPETLADELEIIERMAELEFEIDNEVEEDKLNNLKNELVDIKNKLKKQTARSPASYIRKYTMKNRFGDKEQSISDGSLFFNRWESMLGREVNITTSSDYEHTTQLHINKMYKWYQENRPHVLRRWKKTSKPLYYILEKQELNGNFQFNYERLVKENFKNSEFMKDVNFIYSLFKTNDLTTEKIQELLLLEQRLLHLIIDKDLKKIFKIFKEIIKDRTEDEQTLFELATNFVLNNGEKSKYENIYTYKKMIGIYVSKKLVDKYKRTNYENIINEYNERLENNNINLSYLFNGAYDIYFQGRNQLEVIEDKFEIINNKPYKMIYKEEMYIKGYITENEIMATYHRDISDFKESIKELPNHKDNIREEFKHTFKVPILEAPF